jgi:hypothetical protein
LTDGNERKWDVSQAVTYQLKPLKDGAPGGLQSKSYTLSLYEQLKLSQNVPDI